MPSSILNITVDCARPYVLAEFWGRALGRPVHPDNEPSDDEVLRLLADGAVMSDDRRTPDGKGWAVLQDPEGNEVCVLRSAAERHP